jgi:hypothetical protein
MTRAGVRTDSMTGTCLVPNPDIREHWTPDDQELAFLSVKRGSGGPKGQESLAQDLPRERVLR